MADRHFRSLFRALHLRREQWTFLLMALLCVSVIVGTALWTRQAEFAREDAAVVDFRVRAENAAVCAIDDGAVCHGADFCALRTSVIRRIVQRPQARGAALPHPRVVEGT